MPSVKDAISAYVADGTTTDYLITWDYLDEDHIAVYVDGTSNADPTASHTFSKLNDTTLRITDELGNAIASGAEIEIRRETPLTTRAITFADGSALLASDLNKNSDYLLYSMQEVLDTVDAAAQDGALAAQVATEELRDETETLKNTTAGYLATVQSDATDADNHRIAAAASQTASAASQAAAATSETNAATSATNSANSATASANSATASAASAAASLASEQASAASETAAAASETAAAASETAAAASETAAATSEANAEAAWDNFDDRYLGSKATPPTVDNDGDALVTGALYWNSGSDTMFVWDGTSWDTLNSTTGLADGASSTVVTISSDNKVGINEGTPTNTLHLKDTSSAGIKFDGNGTGTASIYSTYGNMNLRVNADGDNSASYYRFLQGTDEIARLTADGKLGLGTTGPAFQAQIEKSDSGNVVNSLALMNPNSSVVGTGTRLWMSGSTTNTRGAYIESVVQNTGNAHKLNFATSGNAATPTTQLSINGYRGNVGIGTDDPISGYDLHVKKGAGATGWYTDDYATAVFDAEESRVQIAATNTGSDGAALILSTGPHNWVWHNSAVSKGNDLILQYNQATANGGNIGTSTGKVAFKIDKSGRVRAPETPMGVLVGPNGSGTNARRIGYDTKQALRGGMTATTGSTSRFTVPITGYYYLACTISTSATSANLGDGIRFSFLRNGSKIYGDAAGPLGNYGASNGTEMIFSNQTITYMNANDYVETYFDNVSTSALLGDGTFTIQLIG